MFELSSENDLRAIEAINRKDVQFALANDVTERQVRHESRYLLHPIWRRNHFPQRRALRAKPQAA